VYLLVPLLKPLRLRYLGDSAGEGFSTHGLECLPLAYLSAEVHSCAEGPTAFLEVMRETSEKKWQNVSQDMPSTEHRFF